MCLLAKYLKKNIEPTNFIFGEGLPSDPGRKLLDFDKKYPRAKGGCGGPKFGSNDKRL